MALSLNQSMAICSNATNHLILLWMFLDSMMTFWWTKSNQVHLLSMEASPVHTFSSAENPIWFILSISLQIGPSSKLCKASLQPGEPPNASLVIVHYGHQVLDYLRMLWIQIWTSEPHYQHQNPFERRYQTFKRIVSRTMDRTGCPPHLWYQCVCYVAHVLIRVSDPTLRYQQPYLVTTGQIVDISSITAF